MSRLLLPAEGVGLEEGDLVAAIRQRLAAGRDSRWRRRSSSRRPGSSRRSSRAWPQLLPHLSVRGSSAWIASSSSTRCAQVWRSRIAARPVAMQLAPQLAVVQHRPQWPRHLGAVRGHAGRLPGGTAPRRRATARRPAGCRRPAPRTRGWSGCRAAPRRRVGAARGRSPDAGRTRRARRGWAASRDSRSRLAPARPAPRPGSGRRGPWRCRRSRRTGSTRNRRSSCARSPSPQLPIQTRSAATSASGSGRNRVVSAASCQIQTRLAQPAAR